MMDREHQSEVPKQQVAFFDFIVIPMYRIMSVIFPGAKPLLDASRKNKHAWEELCKTETEFAFGREDEEFDSDEEVIIKVKAPGVDI